MKPRAQILAAVLLSALLLGGEARLGPAQTAPQAAVFPDPLDKPLFEGIEATIGDAPLVAFGECSHFALRLHEFSNALFRELVEKKGFRVFMLESAWAANDYLTEFIRSDKPDIEGWMSFYLNAFSSEPTRRTLLYIRDYNKKHPDDPLQIAGMQPEQPWTDWRELKATLTKASLPLPAKVSALIDRVVFGGRTFATDIEVIGFHGKMSRAKQRILSDDDLTGLKAGLDEIDRFLEANAAGIARAASPAAFEEAKLRVLGLRFYGLGVLPNRDFGLIHPDPTPAEVEAITRDTYNMGDAYRFRIIKTQLSTRFKGKKVFIWMHTWHAAKRSEAIETTISGQPPKGTTSLGTLLFREYGDRYKVIHSVVAAPDFKYPAGVVTIDNAFYKLFGDKPAYVDLLHPTAAQKVLPLDKFLPQHSLIDDAYGGGFIINENYDGVAYFPRSGLTVNLKR